MACKHGRYRMCIYETRRYFVYYNCLFKQGEKMKCIMCSGELKEKIVDYKEYGISLGKFKGRVCLHCNETYFDPEVVDRIQTKSKELGLFGLAKTTKVAQVGNSLAVRIPKELVDFLKLKKEETVKIMPKTKNQLLIEISS